MQGALPLIHTQCCVFKVHGDYRDTRIRNTPAELDEYPEEFDKLLDQIFDEFGLVVCGWSADWDVALRQAISRAPSRRFTTYWAVRGRTSDEAQRLIDHRSAQVVGIEDADSFFSKVQERVQSIEEFSRPHPLSTEAAVASLKRYLPEARHQIRLDDLVMIVCELRSMSSIAMYQPRPFVHGHASVPTKETITARVRAYDAACSTLLAMAPVGGPILGRGISLLGPGNEPCSAFRRVPLAGGNQLWLSLRKYPGTLLLYALGLGAVSSDRLQLLGRMFSVTVHDERTAKHSLLCNCYASLFLDVAKMVPKTQ